MTLMIGFRAERAWYAGEVSAGGKGRELEEEEEGLGSWGGREGAYFGFL